VVDPHDCPALVDTFTFSFLLSGQDGGGKTHHRARTVTLQGQRLMALSSEPQLEHQVLLPLVLK